MSYNRTAAIARTIRNANLEMIERLEADAERVMSSGRYSDRWLTLLSDGQAYFTTEDRSQIQYPLPVLMDLDRPLHRDEVRDEIIQSLAEAIRHAETALIDICTGEELGQATAEELLESWLSGPTGAIQADVEGETKTVYASI